MKEKTRSLINIPNIITFIRIIATVVLYFTEVLSMKFYIVYTIGGISDVLDGYLARKLKQTSEFGSKLDSAADLFYYITMMILIYPILCKVLPAWIWIFIWLIVALRALLYIVYGLLEKTLMSNHTILNKITGFVFFLIPYFLKSVQFKWYALLVCVIALIAAVYEGIICIKEMICKEEIK